jgi:hypothetical protein
LKTFLRKNGYLVLRSVIPQTAIGELEQLLESSDEFWVAQEIPIDNLDPQSCVHSTAQVLSEMVAAVLLKALGEKFLQPPSWTNVTYVRRKQTNEYTRRHKDFEFFSTRHYVSNQDQGAYTWWTPLSKPEKRGSHLQLFSGESRWSPNLEVGDIVIFHQSVYHEATTHRCRNPRFSLDGRFFLRD